MWEKADFFKIKSASIPATLSGQVVLYLQKVAESSSEL